MNTYMTLSNVRRLSEISAVILTGLGKFIFVDLIPIKFWYILSVVVAWTLYVIIRTHTKPGILRYWGFSHTNFKKLFLVLLPICILISAAFFLYGIQHDTVILNWHIFPTLLLYPIWGVIQQFLMVALIAGNLKNLQGIRIHPVIIIIITAVLFSIVHYPSSYLIAGTFLLAILYSTLYLKYNNLWVLGLYHGWLGGVFYFFVLKRDPWAEVLITIQ